MSKIGRNEPCPCGSGKKYKKCCIDKLEFTLKQNSTSAMDDLIDMGYHLSDKRDFKAACDVWLEVWEALRNKHKPEHTNLDFMDLQYRGRFFVSNFVQDLEHFLHNAGLDDKIYFEKRIRFCREFLDCFPEEAELITHNMRRAIADSYVYLDDLDQADREYKKLVEDYPNNPWGYIGWGDAYFFGKSSDYTKAKLFYERALSIAKDKNDINALQERLEDLGELE